MANNLPSPIAAKRPLYTVTFEWREYYEAGKTEGVNSISVTVHADTNFKALDVAWTAIASLGLSEPTKFNAQRAEKS